VIASFVDADGLAKKSLSEIASAAGLNRRTVIVAVQYLERLGLLNVTRRREFDGGRASSQYRLLTSKATPMPIVLDQKPMRLCG
jgi:DNA-binding IclR family transcriptional regulator